MSQSNFVYWLSYIQTLTLYLTIDTRICCWGEKVYRIYNENTRPCKVDRNICYNRHQQDYR